MVGKREGRMYRRTLGRGKMMIYTYPSRILPHGRASHRRAATGTSNPRSASNRNTTRKHSPRLTLGDLVSLPEKLLLLVCVPPVIQAAAAPEVPCPEPIIPAPILPLANVFLSPLVPHLVVAVDEALAVELEPLGLLLFTNECTDPGE